MNFCSKSFRDRTGQKGKLRLEGSSKGTSGFSLIEILVVLVIIASLAALLFPFIRKAIERSQEARCVSNLRNIGLAIGMYGADHNMELPPGNQDGDIWSNLNTKSWLREYGANGSEQGAKGLLRCPADLTSSPITDYKYYYSYTWNSDLLQAYKEGGPSKGRVPTKILKVQSKILFADGITNAEDPGKVPKYPPSTTYQNVVDRVSGRHHEGANCLWGDGSVRWVALKDTQNAALWRSE